ncbi:hypothetical protein DL770_007322 [Monosporascus sp. CRB-9-2]|nr:hypothetical protein DL770_007322 [Monosporascus sp. CRB-9-2]
MADLVELEFVTEELTRLSYLAKWNEKYRFYYLSHMTNQEVCIFKIFDSAALDDYGDEQRTTHEPRATAFNIAFDTGDDFLAFMRNRENCEELKAMHGLLGFVMSGTNMGARNHDMDMLAGDTMDWKALGGGLVVDMGGAYGHVCASIARKNPKLRFIVQDLPQIIEQARREILNTTEGDASVASRITFMEHDFLHPQTVTDADVFMFRFVIHDWSDKYVLRILENLLHAMKPTTRIVIMDYVLGAAGSMPKVVERFESCSLDHCW